MPVDPFKLRRDSIIPHGTHVNVVFLNFFHKTIPGYANETVSSTTEKVKERQLFCLAE